MKEKKRKTRKSAIQIARLGRSERRGIHENSVVEFHTIGGVLCVSLSGGGQLRIDHRDHHSLIIRPISHDAMVIGTKNQNDI